MAVLHLWRKGRQWVGRTRMGGGSDGRYGVASSEPEQRRMPASAGRRPRVGGPNRLRNHREQRESLPGAALRGARSRRETAADFRWRSAARSPPVAVQADRRVQTTSGGRGIGVHGVEYANSAEAGGSAWGRAAGGGTAR